MEIIKNCIQPHTLKRRRGVLITQFKDKSCSFLCTSHSGECKQVKMGLEGLKSFVEHNYPEVSVSVDLLKLSCAMGYKMPRRLPSNPLHIYQPANLCLVIDGDSCLDRLYGGFYNDWICGGQWNRVVEFLGQLTGSMVQKSIEAVIYFNGSLEKDRIQTWTLAEVEKRKRASDALRHVQTKQTPPSKVLWVQPPGICSCLRLALRHLNIPVLQSVEDHEQEVIGYLRENGYDAICAESFEYCFFDPPRFFSSRSLKLTMRGTLMTTEFVIDEMAKKLNLHPNRLCVLAAMMGSHILPQEELQCFYSDLLTNTSSQQQKNDYSVIIPAVVAFIRSLPLVDDLSGIGQFVFRNVADAGQKQSLADRFVKSVRYFMNGTKLHYRHFFQPLAKAVPAQHSASGPKPPLSMSPTPPKINPLPNGCDKAQIFTAGKRPQVHLPLLPVSSGHFSSQDLLKTAVLRHNSGLMHPWVYHVLAYAELKLESFIEDPSLTGLPYGWSIFRPVRQSVYAILFNLNHNIVSSKLERVHHHGGNAATTTASSSKSASPDTVGVSSNAKAETCINDSVNNEAVNQSNSVNNNMSESGPGKYPSSVAPALPQNQSPSAHAFQSTTTRVVREWVYLPKPASYEQELVAAVPVEWRGMPTVERLWFGRKPDNKQKRLKAFLVCMNSDTPLLLDPHYVPQHLLLFCCVLRYLVAYNERPILQPFELDALLAQALSPKLHDTTYLQSLKVVFLNPRSVQLAHIVMQGVDHALFANDACGSPVPLLMCYPWLYFDGKLLQQKLQFTQKNNLLAACDDDAALALQVERTREAVLQNIQMPFCRSMAAVPLWAMHMGAVKGALPYFASTAANARQNGVCGGGSSAGGKLEIAGIVVGQWGANDPSKYKRGSSYSTRGSFRQKATDGGALLNAALKPGFNNQRSATTANVNAMRNGYFRSTGGGGSSFTRPFGNHHRGNRGGTTRWGWPARGNWKVEPKTTSRTKAGNEIHADAATKTTEKPENLEGSLSSNNREDEPIKQVEEEEKQEKDDHEYSTSDTPV